MYEYEKTKKPRANKIEEAKKKMLILPLIDKWVCVKQIIDDEVKYIYVKHRLRDPKTINRIEQIILSPEPYESGVYYITKYEMDKVLDWMANKEIIEIRPLRYEMEIGLDLDKINVGTYEELQKYLLKKNYLSREELQRYSDYYSKPDDVEEILFGF